MRNSMQGSAAPGALLGLVLALSTLGACDESISATPAPPAPSTVPSTPPDPPATPAWQTVAKELPEALLSVSGTSSTDVWAVGADKSPTGPLVLHYDGKAWASLNSGQHADLWWVHALPGGPVFMAGAGGMVLRVKDGVFERMKTPGLGKDTVFGVWAASAQDAYAVGGWSGHSGFLWHFDGAAWKPVRLPDDMPRLANGEVPGLFKVWGSSAQDVWVVGGAGAVLRGNAAAGFKVVPTATKETLFTIHGASDGLVATVGGGSNGVILEQNGAAATLGDASPVGAPLIQGVFLMGKGLGYASGERGLVYGRQGDRWSLLDHGQSLGVQSLHSAWVDETGRLWSVGGNVLSPSLDKGAILTFGAPVASYAPASPVTDGGVGDAPVPVTCPPATVAAAQDKSVARQWDEQILASIRRDLPRPPVHARNLFHMSAAMWDAWASYDTTADGVFVTEKNTSADTEAARREAVSYAAYRILSKRYAAAVGGAISLACYDAVLKRLGYDPAVTTTVGTTPSAVGNRIAAAILAAAASDGANEGANYADPGYVALNPALVMDQIGTPLATNPELWQPLNLAVAATQNGIVLPAGVQTYIGSQWGLVTPFALKKANASDPWHDPGPTPKMGASMRDWVKDVLSRASELDPGSGKTVDISPGAFGNNALGADDGTGHATNPVTGLPYAANVVLLADFGRSLAEFWADGPKSETPPGHWNTLANYVADAPGFSRKFEGAGATLDAFEWDVKIYLALNGALHDAACTAWDIKRRYQAGRPTTYVRYMGGKGQATDLASPAFSTDGLPLVPGLIEVITRESSAAGQRHEHLHLYVGQIAVRSWRSEPGDRAGELGGVGWIRAVEWFPYQRRNFVTPPFPGFISGHSTYSRSAAEVLAALTGSAFFPGGLGEYTISPGFLSFEKGPTVPIKLQWATYYDAADQAGQSRIWGGIHIVPDDYQGRVLGSLVGKGATALAKKHFDGSAR